MSTMSDGFFEIFEIVCLVKWLNTSVFSNRALSVLTALLFTYYSTAVLALSGISGH